MVFSSRITAWVVARFTLLALASGVTGLAFGAEPKWPTDDTLRASMASIRKVVIDHHTLVTHRRLPPADARRFADTIRRETDHLKGDAKISPGARAALVPILSDIAGGAEAVAGRSPDATPIDGIVRIDAALARYPLQFDDPTWKPLR